jgi:hypothetical protein
MNDETAPQTYQEDDTPTKPVGKPAEGWVMPEPVFRKSSGGTLPRRLGLGPDGQAAAATPAPADQPTPAAPPGNAENSAPTATPAVAIAEQPDLSADFSLPEDNAPRPAEKRRSGAVKILLIVLGLAGILLVIGVFLVVIYLLFFSRVSESQTF